MSDLDRGVFALAMFVAMTAAACGQSQPFSDVREDRFDATDAPQTPIGSACGLDQNGEALGGCSTGQTCLTPRDGYPNGYCAGDCLRTACPDGTECYPVDAMHHYCIRRCSTDADCRRAEGYVCIPPRPSAPPACLPNPEPVGQRPDGTACYARGDGDAGTGPFLSPLPAITFTDVSTSVSRNRIGTAEENDPMLAIDPSGQHDVLVSYSGYYIENGVSYWRGGISDLAPDTTYRSAQVVRDHDFPDVTLVEVAYDRTGRLHLVFFAENTDRPGNPIRYASSDDGGANFTTAAYLFPHEMCLLRCDEPALAIGPGMNPAQDNVYATMTQSLSNGTTSLFFAAAPAATGVFLAPFDLADVENGTTARRTPSVSAVAAGAAAGLVFASWVGQNVDNPLALLGDRENRVRVRVSRDAGATFGPMVEISRTMDAPTGLPPSLDAAPGVVHLVYVSGGLGGSWSIVLATSHDDGASWAYRVVNDDMPCATHAWAAVAADPVTGDAHVLWLDNRFGPGEVAYSRCPADVTQGCSRNELVSGEPFAFSTTQDPARWLGTRSSLRLAPDGTLWAAWADTRTGGPGIYVVRGHPVAH